MSLASESPEQLHRAFQDAFNRHDVDSIVALYEEGAVLSSAEGPVRGGSAIRAWYEAALAQRPTIELQTLSVEVVGTLAMLHGKWTLHRRGPDGEQISSVGWNAETARQQADGRWLFVIDHPRTAGPS